MTLLVFFHRGAEITAADNNSYTPLITAAANGQVGAFNMLRERGAKLDRLDRDGKTIIFLAAEANHVPILKVRNNVKYCTHIHKFFMLEKCLCNNLYSMICYIKKFYHFGLDGNIFLGK